VSEVVISSAALNDRRHDHDYMQRGRFAVADIRRWRERIAFAMQAAIMDDNQVELDVLQIEMKECWDVLKILAKSVEHVRKIRDGEYGSGELWAIDGKGNDDGNGAA
jgi:hypothetical protein